MEITRFDRHESMNDETRSEILQVIRTLSFSDESSFKLENYLYGLFDGYDYTPFILNSEDFKNIKDKELTDRVTKILDEVNKYPRVVYK
jgi:hypothetical protein